MNKFITKSKASFKVLLPFYTDKFLTGLHISYDAQNEIRLGPFLFLLESL